jgi:hypothetical protein
MPHAIALSGIQIVGYDASKAQPLPEGWAYVSPEQFALAQTLPYPNYLAGEVVNIIPPEPEPVIPTSLSRRQAKRILNRYGLLDGVEAIIATLSKDDQIDYEDAGYFERSNPLIQAVANTAGMTSAQLDEMFIAGNLL